MVSDKVRYPKGGGCEATVVTDGLVDYVVTRLAFSVRKYQLKKEVSLILYGPTEEDGSIPKKLIAINTFEVLCKKARGILHERSVAGKELARQESVGFYENMLADSTVSDSIKIKARENLDLIHSVAIAPMSIVQHRVMDIDKMGLTLEQKKKLLEEIRASDS